VHSNAVKSEVSAKPVAQIRVMAYNIAHGRGATDDNWEEAASEKRKRIDDIARLIAKADADVVVLNEVDFCSTWSGHQNQAEAIALSAGYPYWVEQRNVDFRFVHGSWKFGNAVLSKFPIVDTEAMEFPALRTSEQVLGGCKQGVVCTLQLSQSQQICILAVHLEHRSEDTRVASARLIIQAAESSEIPLLALGDFNSTPSAYPNSQRSAQGRNAMDLIVESGEFELNAQEQPARKQMTYPSKSPTHVIDWILVPKGWRFSDYQILSSHLSDHRPVVADVHLPTEDGE